MSFLHPRHMPFEELQREVKQFRSKVQLYVGKLVVVDEAVVLGGTMIVVADGVIKIFL